MLSWRGVGPRDSGTNRLRSWKLSPSTPFHFQKIFEIFPQSFLLGIEVPENAGLYRITEII